MNKTFILILISGYCLAQSENDNHIAIKSNLPNLIVGVPLSLEFALNQRQSIQFNILLSTHGNSNEKMVSQLMRSNWFSAEYRNYFSLSKAQKVKVLDGLYVAPTAIYTNYYSRNKSAFSIGLNTGVQMRLGKSFMLEMGLGVAKPLTQKLNNEPMYIDSIFPRGTLGIGFVF